MSRKHFQAIADALNKDLKHRLYEQDQRRTAFVMLDSLCHQFKQMNPRFDTPTFMATVMKDVPGTCYYTPEWGFTHNG